MSAIASRYAWFRSFILRSPRWIISLRSRIVRWDPPLWKGPQQPGPQFFFYSARVTTTAPVWWKNTLSRRPRLHRIALYIQSFFFVPLCMGWFEWEYAPDGTSRVPGTNVKLPMPDGESSAWEKVKGRAKRRIEIVVEKEGKSVREYYDPSPRSILEDGLEAVKNGPEHQILGIADVGERQEESGIVTVIEEDGCEEAAAREAQNEREGMEAEENVKVEEEKG